MDPLSVVASCLALITAVQKSARFVTSFVVTYQDARQDLAAVSHELLDLEMTLHILKSNSEAKQQTELPENMHQRICDVMGNCTSVLAELDALLQRYDDSRSTSAMRWALSGRRDVEKIRSSLGTHKAALSLITQVTTL
jgi:hypothetical protein